MFRQFKELFSTAKKPAKKQPKTLQYEELEQRVLFSADFVPGLDNIAVEEQALVQDIGSDFQAEREAAPETVEQTAAEARWELVIINEDVADYDQLIAGLQGSNNNRIIEEVVLDADRNGIEQVSEILAERSNVAAVHFITHGSDGQINLGNSRLTSTTLAENSDAVAGWGKALTETGDILFYGCNIAAASDGQTLLDNIASLIGTDVAASDDVTGHTQLGGDWDLEYVSGTIETEISVRSNSQEGWSHLLAPPTITSDGGGDTAVLNVAENTTAVTTVTATDADSDPISYGISGGADAAKFSINSATGELIFDTVPDFETPNDANGDNVYEVTVQAVDGNGGTDTQAIWVTVTDITGSDAPVLTLTGPALSYTENDPATVLDPAATVVDIDSVNFKKGTLTVSFSAGGTANDELSIMEGGVVSVDLIVHNVMVNGKNIGSFSGGTGGTPLVISWGSKATPADAQFVLRQIAYSNISESPSTAPRTIDFVLTDGDGGTSNTAQQTVNVTSVNDDPLVATNDELSLSQGATALIPNSLLRISDLDNTTAEVSYTLTVAPTNGTLKLNGTALGASDTFTQADIDAELFTYVHGGADTNPDSFTFTTADGVGGTLGPTVFNFNIQTDPAGNDAPVLTLTGPALSYTENDPATVLDPTATVVDIDSADFKKGTLTVSFSAGGTANDELSIKEGGVVNQTDNIVRVNGKNIGSFSGGTGGTPLVISWGPQATPADAQAVLRQISYHNTSDDPSTATRTIDFVLTDGDHGGTSNTAQQTVNIIAVPDAPTKITLSRSTVDENTDTTAGYSVDTLTTTDPDSSAPFTYTIVGGIDAALFSIGGAGSDELILTDGVLDHETQASYSVIVRSTDDTALSFDQTLTITVTDVNEFDPVASDAALNIDENATNGTSVGTVTANDADTTQTLNYAITAGNESGAFSINAATGEITVADGFQLDYETTTQYVLTVQVTDNVAPTRSGSATITIDVNDLNEAPTVSLTNLVNNLTEDTDTSTAIKIADIVITDDALGTNNLTLAGADAASFEIIDNELRLKAGTALDFETKASFDVTVQVDDAAIPGSPEDTALHTLNITDVNEVPTVSLTNLVNNLTEDTDTSTAIKIADIVITDDALGTNNLTLAGADAASFEIIDNELRLKAGTALDFETKASFDVTVQVDDAAIPGSPEDTALHTLNITDVNEVPTVSLTNLVNNLTEDTDTSTAIKIADIVITDDALGTNNLTLAGADAASFEIIDNELRLKAGTALDFETKASFDVTVQVDDAAIPGSPEDTALHTLNITDVNEVPTVSLTNLVNNLTEDTDTSTAIKIADIVITDDALGTNNLTLAGADAASFEIIDNELRLKAGTALDFETKASFDVTVQVDDAAIPGSPEDTALHTLNITDVNEVPTVSLTNLVNNLTEDTDTSTAIKIADIVITDDALGTNNLTLAGADAASFEIIDNELRLKAGTALDFETKASFDVTVQVDDAAIPGSPEDTALHTLNITDVNEVPTVSLTNLVNNLTEDTDTSTAIKIADIVITDDALGTNNLTLAGADAASFEIIDNELRLKAGTALDFETKASFDVTVQVDDAAIPGSPEDTALHTLNITDVNEVPTVSLTNLVNNLTEDTDTSTAIKIADIVITDDALGTNNLTLAGADAASFEIIDNELRLKAGTALDFETKASFDVTVQVDDAAIPGSPEDTALHTLNITDVNEVPTVSLTNLVNNLTEDTDTSTAIKIADIVITDDALGTNNLTLAGADAASFEIIDNELRLKAGTALDFETKASFDVTVQVDDAAIPGSPEDTALHTLNITDVNEVPTVSLTNLVNNLTEDTDTSTAIKIADIVITDDALGTNNLTLAGADAASFEIIDNELRLKAGTALDFETKASFDVTVQVDDAAIPGSPEDTALHTLNITDVNEVPTVSLTNLVNNLTEDTDTSTAIKIADIVITDDALGTNNLTLAGADAASFEIIDNELRLKAGTALDFETKASFDVTVQVDDAAIPGSPEDSAAMAISITDANEAPSVVDDNASGNEDTALVGNVLNNDSDVEGDTLTARLVSGPAHGSLALNADGSFSYTPDTDWNGTDSFTYTTNDGALDSNVATMTITVNPVNDAPSVPSRAITTATEDAAYSYTITANDIDGDGLTITASTLPAWLTLVDNGDGTATLSGTPTDAEVGDHSVELEIDDGALTELQDFTLTVSEATIDPPVDDGDPDLRSSTNPDPELFENPETNDEQDPDTQAPIHEDPAKDPVIEAEQAAPIVEDLALQDSAHADDELIHMQDPKINEEILYLTDDDDMDSQSEERDDDPSIIYYDNDLYKDLSLSKYVNINYTAADGPISSSGDDISILNFDSDDPMQVDVNGDYDLHRQEIDESFNNELKSQATKATIVSITAASFAAGFVSYLLRAGSLIANLMSTVPLWRGFDPIVIFSGDKKKKKDRNDIPKTNEAKSETLFDDEEQ